MKPATIAWLAKLRAQAAEPGIIYVAVRGPRGTIPVFPEDVTNKSDEQLLAFLCERLSATPTRGQDVRPD